MEDREKISIEEKKTKKGKRVREMKEQERVRLYSERKINRKEREKRICEVKKEGKGGREREVEERERERMCLPKFFWHDEE